MAEEEITGIFEFLDALEVTIKTGDSANRKALAKTMDAYHEDFPDDFHWAIGPQAPALLHMLMTIIDAACRSDKESKPRGIIRLVDRKPEGNA